MKKMLIYWKVPLLLCCLAVVLEFFVFNFRHWESYLWRDEHVLMQEWLVGPGLRQIEPTLYEVTEAEGEETATIELLNINRELHNIHVGLKIENPSTPQDEAVNIQLKVTDGANQKYSGCRKGTSCTGCRKANISGCSSAALRRRSS